MQGCRLLRKPQVRAAVASSQARHLAVAEAGAERTLEEVDRIAFCDIRDFLDDDGRLKSVSKLSPAARAALASVRIAWRTHADGSRTERTKVKLWDKVRALEMLAKHFKLLVEKV